MPLRTDDGVRRTCECVLPLQSHVHCAVLANWPGEVLCAGRGYVAGLPTPHQHRDTQHCVGPGALGDGRPPEWRAPVVGGGDRASALPQAMRPRPNGIAAPCTDVRRVARRGDDGSAAYIAAGPVLCHDLLSDFAQEDLDANDCARVADRIDTIIHRIDTASPLEGCSRGSFIRRRSSLVRVCTGCDVPLISHYSVFWSTAKGAG